MVLLRDLICQRQGNHGNGSELGGDGDGNGDGFTLIPTPYPHPFFNGGFPYVPGGLHLGGNTPASTLLMGVITPSITVVQFPTANESERLQRDIRRFARRSVASNRCRARRCCC